MRPANVISSYIDRRHKLRENQMASILRGRLHGEFQPGLKFQTAHRAEILLQLHDEFQPGCNV